MYSSSTIKVKLFLSEINHPVKMIYAEYDVQLQALLTSALDGSESPASHPSRFTLVEKTGWVPDIV
jgi:hypothetical protein